MNASAVSSERGGYEYGDPKHVSVDHRRQQGPWPRARESALDVNLVGPFRLAKAIVGSMALRGRGLMISITSDAAIEAYSHWGAYGITKAALDHMTRILAAELHDMGVCFLSIDPGDMDTRMHADAIPDADPATLGQPGDVA